MGQNGLTCLFFPNFSQLFQWHFAKTRLKSGNDEKDCNLYAFSFLALESWNISVTIYIVSPLRF
jgi:hypothetical protein